MFRKTLKFVKNFSFKQLSLSGSHLTNFIKTQHKASSTSIPIQKEKFESGLTKQILRGKFRLPYTIKINDEIHGFKLIKKEDFPEFEMVGYTLHHIKTGATYYHIDCADINNSFVVHFKTPAFDNTGIFHILEHLTLCGSQKYPVRDPFMNMIKRSLNNYMNAWTGPDFTMYPFSTHNEKDFKNLLEVYLDAVFFPRLDYHDFLQEGWRYEFFEQDNKNSDILFKGVVFNEMKGDMARQDTHMIQKILTNIFPTNTYKFCSGGDPQFITTLQHQDLVNAHKKYYSPSNSKFITYGDLNFLEHLEMLDEILNKVPQNQNAQKIEVDPVIRFEYPKEIIDTYQPEMELGDSNLAKMAISYVCNDTAQDPYTTFKMSFLSQLLMEGPNSTMFKRIIESGIAPGYCPGYGFDTSIKEGLLTIGVQNIENDHKKFNEISKSIYEGLEDVSKNGINPKFIEEVLHLIEYDSKKPRNDFGINFFNQSSGFITHGDPFAMLHVNEFSRKIREELKSKKVFQDLVTQYLIQNDHRLNLILKPDYNIVSKQNSEEFGKLINIKNHLTEEKSEKIIQDTLELNKRQNQLQDHNILPTISIEDIPKETEKVEFKVEKLAHDIPLYVFDQPTNGLSFIRFKTKIDKIPQQLKEYLELYTRILPKLGTDLTGYEEFQNLLLTYSSGISVYIDSFNDRSVDNLTHENLVFEFSFLDRNTNKAIDLLEELLTKNDFFDYENINQLIKMESVKIANEITSSAIDYAMSYAQEGLKKANRDHEKFKYDIFLCQLGAELLKTSDPKLILGSISEKLKQIHYLIFTQENLSCSYHGNKKNTGLINSKLSLVINSMKNDNEIFFDELIDPEVPKFEERYHKKIFKTPSQVSDCAEAFKIPLYSHEDYAKCVIMANLMGLNNLHKEIREKGGAYSGGASPSDNGVLVLYSYRDPNPSRTMKEFEKAIVNISKGKFEENDIKEAKIFTFSQIDKIINPSSKGLIYFLRNIDEKTLNEFRVRLMDVTKEDIMRVAKEYLLKQLEDGTSSRVIFGSQSIEESEFINDGWEISSALDFLSEKYFKEDEQEFQ